MVRKSGEALLRVGVWLCIHLSPIGGLGGLGGLGLCACANIHLGATCFLLEGAKARLGARGRRLGRAEWAWFFAAATPPRALACSALASALVFCIHGST